MALFTRCEKCQSELFDPGAQILTPPDMAGYVKTVWLCRFCWENLVGVFFGRLG